MVMFNPRSDFEAAALSIARGNPGAIQTVADITLAIGPRDAMSLFQQMEAMNIVGANVWIAYKNGCDFDIERLIAGVRGNDIELVTAINRFAAPDKPAQLRS